MNEGKRGDREQSENRGLAGMYWKAKQRGVSCFTLYSSFNTNLLNSLKLGNDITHTLGKLLCLLGWLSEKGEKSMTMSGTNGS